MFGRGKKKKQKAQAREDRSTEPARKKSLNGALKFGKNKKKKRKGRSEVGNTLVHPDAVVRNTDSDYDDSAVDLNDDENRILDNDSDKLEVYYDNEEDETTENRGIQSQYSNSVDEESNGEASQLQERELEVPLVSEDEKPTAVQGGLTKEERRARARKAIEERKKKSRLEIAARKAKQEGRPVPVITDTVVEPKRDTVSMVVDHVAAVDQEVRRRTVSEERIRLIELEREKEKEESEALQKEEEEMRELEKALKKEEEEARGQALEKEKEEDAEREMLAEALKKEEEELKELEETLRKKEEEAKSQTLKEEGDTKIEDGKAAVVVETVDSDELDAEEDEGRSVELAKVEAERVVTEELAKRQAERATKEVTAELEAERIREEELAKFEAEVAEKARKLESQEEEERKKAEDEALRALDQFITQAESKDNYMDDGNQKDSAQEPDLDDLLDGSLSQNESTILENVMDGPIVFTPTSQSTDKKIKNKFKAPRPDSKPKVQKPSKPESRRRPPLKKPPVTKPRESQPTRFGDKSNKKRPVSKNKPSQGKTASATPNIVLRGMSNMSHLRPQTNSNSNTRKEKIFETNSIDSSGSVCTLNSIPPSPYRRGFPDMPICKNKYIPKLHAKLGDCQMCIFRLSDVERALYEKNGRHIRVAQTFGGCCDCQIFPSLVGEAPVRLCKQCFFDTHLIAERKVKAFEGTGALSGLNRHLSNYSPIRHRYKGGR